MNPLSRLSVSAALAASHWNAQRTKHSCNAALAHLSSQHRPTAARLSALRAAARQVLKLLDPRVDGGRGGGEEVDEGEGGHVGVGAPARTRGPQPLRELLHR